MLLSQIMKLSLLSRGVTVTSSARYRLTKGGELPLVVKDYTTTGGITIVIGGDVYVNASVDGHLGVQSEVQLDYDSRVDEYFLTYRGQTEGPVGVLPLPGYLHALSSAGQPLAGPVFSHGDRVRVSPIVGCAMNCHFCDLAGERYVRQGYARLREGLAAAIADERLPVHHALVSGGTPSRRDYGIFDEYCAQIVRDARMPVDVMCPPRLRDPGFVRRLVEHGVTGFSINLEIYDRDIAQVLVREKAAIGLREYARTIESAVAETGGAGRVRSLILVGLEPEEKTLAAVRFLATLGCDPVLSPFMPAAGTRLSLTPPPPLEMLRRVYEQAAVITHELGVQLGPRCIPCQHNTLTFPDGSADYYWSASRNALGKS